LLKQGRLGIFITDLSFSPRLKIMDYALPPSLSLLAFSFRLVFEGVWRSAQTGILCDKNISAEDVTTGRTGE
jgi:hypothetical protein